MMILWVQFLVISVHVVTSHSQECDLRRKFQDIDTWTRDVMATKVGSENEPLYLCRFEDEGTWNITRAGTRESSMICLIDRGSHIEPRKSSFQFLTNPCHEDFQWVPFNGSSSMEQVPPVAMNEMGQPIYAARCHPALKKRSSLIPGYYDPSRDTSSMFYLFEAYETKCQTFEVLTCVPHGRSCYPGKTIKLDTLRSPGRWPTTQISYDIKGDFEFKRKAEQVMRHFEQKSCLRFKAKSHDEPQSSHDDGLMSIVEAESEQRTTKCFPSSGQAYLKSLSNRANIAVSLLQILCIRGELERTDRDKYVSLRQNLAECAHEASFNNSSGDSSRLRSTVFDFHSILNDMCRNHTCYTPRSEYSTCGWESFETSPLDEPWELSFSDIEKINQLYDCSGECSPS